MCQHLGIQEPVIPRVATAFGGGIAGVGSVCGAVVGAVMAIGLKHGRADASERDTKAYALTRELCQRFEAAMGALECRSLTQMDLSTREGVKAFYASDVPVQVCRPAVGTAYELAIEVLSEH